MSRPLQKQTTQPTASSQKINKHKKKKETKLERLNVVSLGDSLTHGVGDTTKRGGYVYLLQQRLLKKDAKQVNTANFGKTGDTTKQIKARLDNQPAIKAALKKADVITLTAGGNDLMQVLQNNFQALSSNRFNKSMALAKDSYRQNMALLLKDVRAVNPTAPIFLFSVYDPFYVYFPNMIALQKYTDQWNIIAKKQVKQLKLAYFVDVNQQLSEGQYYGKSKQQLKQQGSSDLSRTASKKIEKILSETQEKNILLSPDDHFHPNNLGYKIMAEHLYQSMTQHKATWFKELTYERK